MTRCPRNLRICMPDRCRCQTAPTKRGARPQSVSVQRDDGNDGDHRDNDNGTDHLAKVARTGRALGGRNRRIGRAALNEGAEHLGAGGGVKIIIVGHPATLCQPAPPRPPPPPPLTGVSPTTYTQLETDPGARQGTATALLILPWPGVVFVWCWALPTSLALLVRATLRWSLRWLIPPALPFNPQPCPRRWRSYGGFVVLPRTSVVLYAYVGLCLM